MKKLLFVLAAACAIILGGPIAYADGLPGGPRRAYVEPGPAPLPAPLWTGFYVGAHLGGGWADVDWSNMVGYATAERVSHSPDGWVGGAQLGYNFQFSPNWVAGIEVSWSGASLSDSSISVVPVVDPDRRRSTDINQILTVTARLGYAWDRWLAYLKGGYAGAEIETSSLLISTGVRSNQDQWQNGWTIGGGLEYILTRNVTVGIEYNFIDLGSDRITAHFNNGPCSGCGMDTDVQIQTLVGRLNFKF
jgi:outer membrane immunogenic protein